MSAGSRREAVPGPGDAAADWAQPQRQPQSPDRLGKRCGGVPRPRLPRREGRVAGGWCLLLLPGAADRGARHASAPQGAAAVTGALQGWRLAPERSLAGEAGRLPGACRGLYRRERRAGQSPLVRAVMICLGHVHPPRSWWNPHRLGRVPPSGPPCPQCLSPEFCRSDVTLMKNSFR